MYTLNLLVPFTLNRQILNIISLLNKKYLIRDFEKIANLATKSYVRKTMNLMFDNLTEGKTRQKLWII